MGTLGVYSMVLLHNKKTQQKITPKGSWVELELYAKNHKLNTFFVDWIDKNREKVYIKYY